MLKGALRTLFLCLFLASAAVAQDFPITAKSVVLFDANSGKVIFKKNENEKRPVASTQKLLTALIVAESGDLSKPVVIEEIDNNVDPTKIPVRPGDTYSRRQLLTALLVKSPNNVARALARDYAGNLSNFALEMNQRMSKLGGTSSNFINPNGLPADGQYSTARDMARVARAVYFNSDLRNIINTPYYQFKFASGNTEILRNTNRVLRTYSFCNGMKTGYTDLAGHCLISSASWNGKDVIAVVLGDNKTRIWDESARLLAYGLGMSRTQMETMRLPPNKLDQ